MTISLRSDASGTSGAIQVNGADKLTLNANGSVKGAASAKAFSNLKLSATGLSAITSITADELVMTADDQSYLQARSVNVNVSVAASGAGGLDSGAVASSTWYAVWVISNGTNVAGLLSLSPTAPALPSGYTHRVRVGWVRTDSTVNKFPLGFVQSGRRVQYRVASGSNLTGMPVMASGTQGSGAAGAVNYTWAAISTSAFFPPTASSVRVVGRVISTNSIALAPNNSYGGDGNASNPPFFNIRGISSNTFLSCYQVEMSLEGNVIYVWSDGASNSFLASGWEDTL